MYGRCLCIGLAGGVIHWVGFAILGVQKAGGVIGGMFGLR